jgi:hypothetical protein
MFLVIALAFAFASSCSKKDKGDQTEQSAEEEEEEEERAAPSKPQCDVDDDCRGNWMCIDGKCMSPSSSRIYRDPSGAATPAKVKREIDKRMKQGEKRLDRGLEMDE